MAVTSNKLKYSSEVVVTSEEIFTTQYFWRSIKRGLDEEVESTTWTILARFRAFTLFSLSHTHIHFLHTIPLLSLFVWVCSVCLQREKEGAGGSGSESKLEANTRTHTHTHSTHTHAHTQHARTHTCNQTKPVTDRMGCRYRIEYSVAAYIDS
jgi:hypothetical protein